MPTKLQGLTKQEVTTRIAAGQTNAVKERTSRSLGDILRANIFTRFNALLAVLTVVVLLVGSPVDALFGLVIIINSAIGVFQELRAKYTLDKLSIINAPTARAVRGGKEVVLPIGEVVLDDTLHLSIGDQIPADAKVLECEGLEVDESLLTGESDPIIKKPGDGVLSGSLVVAGQGYAKATAVGAQSYAHKIAAEVKKFSGAKSDLIEGTNKLLGYISWTIVIVAPLLIWGQLTRTNNGWQDAAVRSIAAVVGMVPEGLVLLTSLAFMVAAIELARRKVLVQQLPAVEGLARVDVICLDKTGTLTEGAITFDQLIVLDDDFHKVEDGVLASFATSLDSPTLQALHEAYKHEQPGKITVPFSSARKWSAAEFNGQHWVMGAPEVVLSKADAAMSRASAVAAEGKRVLVILCASHKPEATKKLPHLKSVALVVLSEKIRPDAKETLQFFAKQGVELKVISGDSPVTVGAIAKAVGLDVKTPVDMREVSVDPADLAKLMQNHNVFGRVSPQQKRAMVKALQSQGHVVAMTGDGVNDALALKDADIGIAMFSGSQATKSVAELVLLDNSFATMPRVLAEGRRVIANIERVANLFVIKNVYSLVLALVVTLAALSYPFLPRQLTVLSSLSIGIPAFFLSFAPNNQRYKPGFLGRVLRFALPVGAAVAVLIFAIYVIANNYGGSAEAVSTLASIVVMVTGSWVLVCVARPLRYWKVLLIAALDAVFAILVLWPPAQEFFGYQVSASGVWWALGLGAVGAAFVEVLWRWVVKARYKRP